MGINVPYLYGGKSNTFFTIHVEDANLYSLNYLHSGYPKVWIVVNGQHQTQLESAFAADLPWETRQCPEYLQHKNILLTESWLTSKGIPYVKIRQEPGDFVITSPGAYHQGCNLGCNLAEAVNFADGNWLVEIGLKTVQCRCHMRRGNYFYLDSIVEGIDPVLYQSWKKESEQRMLLRKRSRKRKIKK